MNPILDFALLMRNRDYGFIYSGQFISSIGTMITMVAIPYQIYQLTQSTLMVGLLSLVQFLPLLITALLGGVLADRFDRRFLLIISELLLMLGCIVLIFNAHLVNPSIVVIFATSCLMSAMIGLHRPIFDSLIQQIVSIKDYKTLAALGSFKSNFCMIVGPTIAGLLIAYYGLVITYLIDLVSFIISLVTLNFIQAIPKSSCEHRVSIYSSLKQGLNFALQRQELISSYLIDFITLLFAWPYALFPAIAQSFGGAKILGVMYAAPAVGALVMSLFSRWTNEIKQHGKAIAISAVLMSISIIAFGLTNRLWLAISLLILYGSFDAINVIFRSILWNETIPHNFRGRLAGIEIISYFGGPKLGDVRAGVIASSFGITASLLSGGLLSVMGIAICCYCAPKFWNYSSRVSNEIR